jgi:hypothetical protein
LGLGYTIKQIYDKHKVIWWARINARAKMTRDDLIKQQRHCLLGLQTQKGEFIFTQKSNHFLSHMGI